MSLNEVIEKLQLNSIIHLDLSFTGIDTDTVIKLAKSLETNTTLQILNLSNNYIGTEATLSHEGQVARSAESVVEIAKSLAINTTLQKLYLGSNCIGTEVISEIIGCKSIIAYIRIVTR